MSTKRWLCQAASLTLALTCLAATAKAGVGNNNCKSLPDYNALKAALVAATTAETSGLNNQMWATIVDRDGVVCAVAFFRSKSRCAMARQPGHLGAKSQHCKCFQSRRIFV